MSLVLCGQQFEYDQVGKQHTHIGKWDEMWMQSLKRFSRHSKRTPPLSILKIFFLFNLLLFLHLCLRIDSRSFELV